MKKTKQEEFFYILELFRGHSHGLQIYGVMENKTNYAFYLIPEKNIHYFETINQISSYIDHKMLHDTVFIPHIKRKEFCEILIDFKKQEELSKIEIKDSFITFQNRIENLNLCYPEKILTREENQFITSPFQKEETPKYMR